MECNLLKLLTSLKSLNCREEEFLFTSENTFYLKRRNLYEKISLTILALVAVLMLASCGKAKKVSIAGSWGADSGSETVYLFNEDGTGKISIGTTVSKSFTYETNDNTLKIVTEILGQKDEQEYTYSIDGDVLTMTRNNESVTYTKQK